MNRCSHAFVAHGDELRAVGQEENVTISVGSSDTSPQSRSENTAAVETVDVALRFCHFEAGQQETIRRQAPLECLLTDGALHARQPPEECIQYVR